MKASIKAALLSALVFPGVGQMSLKRYVRGLIPMVLVLTGLGVLIAQATAGAVGTIATGIVSGSGGAGCTGHV